MALFTTINDEFASHSGQPTNATVYVPKHYNIRSFNGTDLTVPRTMPDFRYWNASSFNGTSMITLSTPRSVVGRSIAARTMGEIDAETQAQLDAQTIQGIELYTLQSGDEGWPVDPNVTVGKNASYRYANTISVTLTGGVQKTISSNFRDNLLTDFPADGSTYYIELALPGFPAQAAGSHLDLANSYIDFSSDSNFAAGQTDSFRFNQSLNSLTAGGNTFFRINRNSLVNADISNIQGVRLRLQSVGNMTFVAQALRLYKSGDFTFPSTAIDTKRNLLARSVPESSSAATEPSTGQGILWFSGTRPENITEIVRFNSGHSPVGNDNYFALYLRYDTATTNAIRVELNARSTQATLSLSEKTNGTSFTTLYTTPSNLNALTDETDYFLKVETDGPLVRATVYVARGAFFGPIVLTTDWRPVTRDARGLVGYDFNPYNYDFTIDYIKASTATFGAIEQASFGSLTPVIGATLYPNASPPEDLSQQNYIPSGDATVTNDPNFGNPAPSSKFVRDGSAFFGGWESEQFLFIGDPRHLTVTGQIYPTVTLNRNFRVLLIDKYDTVAWIAYIPGLRAGQWNEFSLTINADIAPANYRFILQEVGNYADTFWVQDLKLNHDTVAWKASANGGGTWYNFYNAINYPYSGVNFDPVYYPDTVLDAAPVAYYSLGETTSVAVDRANGLNGVIGVGVITGILGAITDDPDRAMSFPGTSSAIVTVGDNALLSFTNNQFSFEFWFQAQDTSSQIGVLGKGNSGSYEYGIFASTPGTLTFNTWNASGTTVYPALSWNYDTALHHVVFRGNGSVATLFVDGDAVATSSKSANNMANTTSNLLIGAATSTTPTSYYMKGMLDEVAVYSYALSDDTIWDHYQTGQAPKSSTALRIRAEALSDTAWIESYKVYPKYGLVGQLHADTPIVVPVPIIATATQETKDLRVTGRLIAPVITKDLRITGFGSAAPITKDVRITGQSFTTLTKDLRINGVTPIPKAVDIRITATGPAIWTQALRTTGTTVNTTTLALRATGMAMSTSELGLRITGGSATTGQPFGMLLALTKP